MSQQVSALERELGVELLERTGRSVHLTAAGRVLVERADAILAGLAETETEVRSIAGASPRALRIASFASASATIVADAVRDSDLDVHILDADPQLGLARLRAGEVDVAILWEYDFVPLRRVGAIGLQRLLDDPVDVVVPRSKAVPTSTNQGVPLLQGGRRDPAAKELRRLVSRFAATPIKAGRYRAKHRAAS